MNKAKRVVVPSSSDSTSSVCNLERVFNLD